MIQPSMVMDTTKRKNEVGVLGLCFTGCNVYSISRLNWISTPLNQGVTVVRPNLLARRTFLKRRFRQNANGDPFMAKKNSTLNNLE